MRPYHAHHSVTQREWDGEKYRKKTNCSITDIYYVQIQLSRRYDVTYKLRVAIHARVGADR